MLELNVSDLIAFEVSNALTRNTLTGGAVSFETEDLVYGSSCFQLQST